jgi:hypothetical protein
MCSHGGGGTGFARAWQLAGGDTGDAKPELIEETNGRRSAAAGLSTDVRRRMPNIPQCGSISIRHRS